LNYLNNQKEELNKEIKSIKSETEAIELAQARQNDDKRTEGILLLKKQIKESDEYHKHLKDQHRNLMGTINKLKISIPIIFERIGCNAEDYS